MARYSEAQGASFSSSSVQVYRNGVPDTNPTTSLVVRQKQINTLSRADLQRRRASSDGFRQPTPYWHQSMVQGLVAGSYSMVQTWTWAGKTVRAFCDGQVSWTGSDLGDEGNANALVPYPDQFVPVPTSVKNSVKSKLRKRIKDEQWNAAVMLAEMRDSVALIGQSAKKLQNALLCLVRKDWKGVAHWLGVPLKKFKDGTKPAEAWLEFHFGWAPIVSDMVSAANFLATVGKHKPRLRVAAGARLKDTGTAKSLTLRIPGGNTTVVGTPWTLSQPIRLETITDYKIICWYELDQGWLRDLSKIGFTNPAELLYNTTPFSWLTEWLVPLGEVLSGLDATIGLRFLSGTETTYQSAVLKTIKDPTYNVQAGSMYPGQRLEGPPSIEFVVRGGSRTQSTRNVLTSTPIPSFLWIENPFSPWRIATSAALMRQLVKGFRL